VAQSQKPAGGFMTYNGDPKKYAYAEKLHMPYCPALHMPDDDMFMENPPALLDQVRSIRAFAPKAKFRVDPISFDTPYARPGHDPRDPRNNAVFASAWCTIVTKYLALGGVDEAVFNVGPAYADLALKDLGALAGSKVLATTTSQGALAPVEALAVETDGKLVIWLANKTDVPQKAAVAGLAGGKAQLERINAKTRLRSGPSKEQATVANGELTIDLAPFETCKITGAAARK